MHGVEIVLVCLLVAVAALAGVARRLDVPYPIVLVIGGLAMGFLPFLPEVELDLDLVLVIFLPPLLYSAAFFAGGLGGIAIGLAVGWVIAEVRKRLDDPPVEVTISLLTGYAAYVPAERVGASGVLAAVTVGIYVGWRAPEISNEVMHRIERELDLEDERLEI